MGEQKKIGVLRVLFLGLAIICLMLFLNSLAASLYDVLNRDSLQAALQATQQQLNKVAVELDYRKADVTRMGTGGDDNLRRKTEQRIAELERDKARLTEKNASEQAKLTTTPHDWESFVRRELKDLLGSLFFLIHIISAIIDMLKGPKILVLAAGAATAVGASALEPSESQPKRLQGETKTDGNGEGAGSAKTQAVNEAVEK